MKKMRLWRIFFVPFFFSFLLPSYPAHATEACTTEAFDETVEVQNVIDGDTLRLKDGRFVRLVGINAPELNTESPPAEPFAQDAKKSLQEILKKQKSIGLVYDKDRRDRYQRLLSHAFLVDGTNVQLKLIEQGMAQHIMVPPNDAFYDCYRNAEAQAQSTNKGLWTHDRYRIMHANELTLRHIGFYHITGVVHDIKTRKGNYWLVLTDRFSFRIDKDDMKYFKKLRPETLRTHTIQVKGWIFPYKSGLNMRIRHPKNIRVLN